MQPPLQIPHSLYPRKSRNLTAHAFPYRGPLGVVIVAVAGVLAGTAVAQRPLLSLVGLGALVVAGYMAMFFTALPRIFLGVLGVVLLGYAFFGRSFAYLGTPPLFVGELILLLGLVAAWASGRLPTVARSPIVWSIVALSLCGAAQTVPYLGVYRVDALRDAALWGYGLFTVLVAACLLNTGFMNSALTHCGKWLGRFVVWAPVAGGLAQFWDVPLSMPGTRQPLLSAKWGDVAVHLSGAAVFVLVGLDRARSVGGDSPRARRLFWVFWLLGVLFVAALNRGGFLAVMAALSIVAVLNPLAVGRRLALYGGACAAALAIFLLISANLTSGSRLDDNPDRRQISPSQVARNILSIVGRDQSSNLGGTIEWRLEWWRYIREYTIFGRYFWTGKGFGVNLATDDGFLASDPDFPDLAPLRSPHNVHMTILARMGVPGTVLWIVFMGCVAVSLLLGHLQARAAGDQRAANVLLWILAYWSAFIVNASFDVCLEGPQGGIWFWSVTGLAVTALEQQRLATRQGKRGWSAG